MDPEELYVATAYADEGATLKRWRPRARGRATRIRKRTCHITVIVARLPEDRLERRRSRQAAATASRSRRVAASRRRGGAPQAEGEVEGVSPSEIARRYYYDAHPIDRRAFQLLVDTLGDTQLVVGTDFPAMPREMPCAKTLRSMDLSADVLENITWNNAFRFLGIEPPKA